MGTSDEAPKAKRVRRKPDPEIAALKVCFSRLKQLDPAAARRAIWWLGEVFKEKEDDHAE